MKARELKKLGISSGPILQAALSGIENAGKHGLNARQIRLLVREVIKTPEGYLEDPYFSPLAGMLVKDTCPSVKENSRGGVEYKKWGGDFDPSTLSQMDNACNLPIAVRGALMPDAHQGYGLPIGGVLAVRDSVIPYAVGMDIGCRMKMSILDLPLSHFYEQIDRLAGVLERETAFGVGAAFPSRRSHAVMDEQWSFCRFVAGLKNKAWEQLGSSGSGNHFVELGTLTVLSDKLIVPAGTYISLLSHSGSRGPGSLTAEHYSRIARSLHPELPRDQAHLAWLDLKSEEGREYWLTMELMGRYASANHELIHRAVIRGIGAVSLMEIENFHNFAWRENYNGQELIIHRKGATPAHSGVLGVIPGSMADPGFVVCGRGNVEALNSAAHGAGRALSRKKASSLFTFQQLNDRLAQKGVKLLSAGLDEVPMAYKNINEVMAAQADLVDIIARFEPKLVKMAEPERKRRRR